MDIERLRREFPARRIDYYPAVDSTMRAAVGLEPGSVVLAGQQTAGQGRHGRCWHSEAGAAASTAPLCSSRRPPSRWRSVSLPRTPSRAPPGWCAICAGPTTSCSRARRWPAFWCSADGNAIAGIGINVNHTSFPRGTGVRSHLSAPPHRRTGLVPPASSCTCCRPWIAFVELDKDTILRLFTRASSYAAGRRVTVAQPDGIIEGTTAGLDPAGFLIVRKDDGTDTLIVAGGVRAAGS